jgi:hypothetical protein
MSGDGLIAVPGGLARRRRERQPLHQVKDLTGQPGREPTHKAPVGGTPLAATWRELGAGDDSQGLQAAVGRVG